MKGSPESILDQSSTYRLRPNTPPLLVEPKRGIGHILGLNKRPSPVIRMGAHLDCSLAILSETAQVLVVWILFAI